MLTNIYSCNGGISTCKHFLLHYFFGSQILECTNKLSLKNLFGALILINIKNIVILMDKSVWTCTFSLASPQTKVICCIFIVYHSLALSYLAASSPLLSLLRHWYSLASLWVPCGLSKEPISTWEVSLWLTDVSPEILYMWVQLGNWVQVQLSNFEPVTPPEHSCLLTGKELCGFGRELSPPPTSKDFSFHQVFTILPP